jgi:hypothetical protein
MPRPFDPGESRLLCTLRVGRFESTASARVSGGSCPDGMLLIFDV